MDKVEEEVKDDLEDKQQHLLRGHSSGTASTEGS